MKIKYGKTREYQKNRIEKIMRNKERRNDYKGKHNGSLVNKIPVRNIKVPEIINVFSNRISIKRTFFEAPSVFSFTNNPDETYEFISVVASTLYDASKSISLTINFDKCEKIDIGALSILDIVIAQGIRFFEKSGTTCAIQGRTPVLKAPSTIFYFSGLPKLFGYASINPKIVSLDPVLTEPTVTGETNRIIKYYNDCLKRAGYSLNDSGLKYFGTLIGEIVDNSIIHCGVNGPMNFSGGYYNHDDSKGQLSIISLGRTLYETLSSSTTDPTIKEKIIDIVNAHKGSGYSEEIFWTICALQERVSCQRNDENKDRGMGTVKFIEAFLEVGQTNDETLKPIMSIISGSTQILFDGKYRLMTNSSGNKKIAFNNENDLKKEPDHAYVKEMKNHFPGVIINIEFYIDKDYLEKYERKE